jgi:hypothetical protein
LLNNENVNLICQAIVKFFIVNNENVHALINCSK